MDNEYALMAYLMDFLTFAGTFYPLKSPKKGQRNCKLLQQSS